MATNKNITMKQFNGTDYDTLYPKTVGAQITGAVPITSGGTNGITASSGVNNLVAGLSQITPASNDLFPFRDISGNTGGSVTLANLAVALGNNGVITPSNLVEQASALGFSRIQTGSYVGTGTGGSSAPNSLTFDFTPRLVIICGDTEYSSGFADYSCKIIAVRGITSTDSIGEDGTSTYVAIGWTDKGLSWYSRSTSSSASILAKNQLNASGKTYYYVAIG